MKGLKRIICFLLMLVSLCVFSACSSGENPPPAGNDSDLSQNGGNENNNSGNDESQNDYVPYTSREIMAIGSNCVDDFFDDFEIDLTDGEKFDDNVSEMKILFMNASKMIKKISEMNNLTYGACVQGREVVSVDGKPNNVARFYATFNEEDNDGNSSVSLRYAFAYEGLDVSLNYDYYDILIKTNKVQKNVSCEISVERSVANGEDDSTAKYFNIEINGTIGGGQEGLTYNVYQFERTEIIDDYVLISSNNITNLQQSQYQGEMEEYVGGEEAQELLRNSTSQQYVMVSECIGNLNQGLKKIFSGGVMSTLSNLSSSLVLYVDGAVEIK